uniref:Fungal lipase-like domain-containing protein n=1 Tax=viral metagenome TaxID=1070528 RepID=A0A6C0KVS3_9ZZZZ
MLTGGALSGIQIYKFFNSMDNTEDENLPENFIPLNKNNSKLYNNKFRVYYNPENIHIVIVHRGTITSSKKDIFNNVRNFISVKNKYLITYRNQNAKEGHNELKHFLIKIYKNKEKYYSTYKTIIDYIKNLMKSSPIATLDNTVDELLETKSSTIGYSQGAVYAYLYGKNSKEVLVFNPAPFFNKKPDNTYVIKNKNDPVSLFNRSKKINVLNKKTKTYREAHSLENFKNVSKLFGNPFLYTKSKKNKTNKKPKSRKNKTNKNKS